jgi:hypothetical protein
VPQWYLDWLIAKLVPRALRGAWEVGIDPLEEGYKPLTEHEEHGVGTIGRWALRWPASPPSCDELTPADYAMYFWYIIDEDRRMVKWQVMGETVFCHLLVRPTTTGASV